MNSLSDRIKRVTEDLLAIQDELDAAAIASPEARNHVMDQMLNLEMMNKFKASVDHMRHLLWAYISANSSDGARRSPEAFQNLRMQRVTEMLRLLKPTMAEAQVRDSPERQSFFEVVQSIANSAMEQHEQGQRERHAASGEGKAGGEKK